MCVCVCVCVCVCAEKNQSEQKLLRAKAPAGAIINPEVAEQGGDGEGSQWGWVIGNDDGDL